MTIPIGRARVCRYCPEGSGIIWYENDAMRMHVLLKNNLFRINVNHEGSWHPQAFAFDTKPIHNEGKVLYQFGIGHNREYYIFNLH